MLENNSNCILDTISYQGVGLGFRNEISASIYQNQNEINCLEILTEQFMQGRDNLRLLGYLRDRFKVVPHGVSLSIGSECINFDHLKKVKEICDIVNAEYYSEHLCITRAPGIDLGHLCPIPYNEVMLQRVIRNVLKIQDFIERPLVLENITYKFNVPIQSITQEEFFSILTHETNCGMLVDVANLHTNSYNHHFNPYQFIDRLPLKHIVQVHLAGGFYTKEGELIDSHNRAVELESLELYEYLNKRANIKTVILEHDDNFPEDFSVFLGQLAIAKKIQQRKSWKEDYSKMFAHHREKPEQFT